MSTGLVTAARRLNEIDPTSPIQTVQNLATFNSNLVSNMFFRGATIRNADAIVQDSAWAGNTMAITTSIFPSKLNIGKEQKGSGTFSGYAPSGGRAYKAPSVHNYSQYVPPWAGVATVTTNPTAVHYFGTPPAPGPGSYGFRITDLNNQTSISDTYRGMFMQPKADTSFIRTATATSLASTVIPTNNSQSYEVAFTQPTPQTITFDKAYVNPPLIFVVDSGGYGIALNYMIQNSSGKYIGASIVVNSTLAYSSYPAYGLGPYQANSTTFKYFIVSDEFPDYFTNPYSSSYGIKVNNASGQMVYSSEYFVPSFYKSISPTPYSYTTGSYSYNSQYSGSTIQPYAYGVCLNNIRPITGYTYILQNLMAADSTVGAFQYAYGTIGVTGHFMNINQATGVVRLEAGFACGLTHSSTMSGDVINALATTGNTTQTYVFGANPSDSIDLLFANYRF